MISIGGLGRDGNRARTVATALSSQSTAAQPFLLYQVIFLPQVMLPTFNELMMTGWGKIWKAFNHI